MSSTDVSTNGGVQTGEKKIYFKAKAIGADGVLVDSWLSARVPKDVIIIPEEKPQACTKKAPKMRKQHRKRRNPVVTQKKIIKISTECVIIKGDSCRSWG